MKRPIRIPATNSSPATLPEGQTTCSAEDLLRAQETIVADISRLIARRTPLESVLEAALNAVAQALSAEYAAWLEFRPPTEDLVVRAGSHGGYCRPGDVVLTARSYQKCWRATQVRHPLIMTEQLVEGIKAAGSPLAKHGIACAVMAPAIPAGNPAGVLSAFSVNPGRFGADELRFVSAAASLMGMAVHLDREQATLKREAAEKSALREAGRVLTSSLDIAESFGPFTTQLRQLFIFERLIVATVDERRGVVAPFLISGEPSPRADRHNVEFALTRLRLEKIVADRKAAVLDDRHITRDWGELAGMFASEATEASILVAPVIHRDEVVGLLSLISPGDRSYWEHELILAQQVADFIGSALSNSASFAAVKRQALERAGLAEISRILEYSLDLSEAFPRFAEAARKLIPYDRLNLRSFDPATGMITSEHSLGSEHRPTDQHVPRPMAGTAASAIAERTTGLIVTPEAIESAVSGFATMRGDLLRGLKSTLAVPVIHRNQTVGSLVFRARQQGLYTEPHIVLAERIAAQISGAMVGSEALQRAQRASRERGVLADLSRAAASASGLGGHFELLHQSLAVLIPFDRMEIVTREGDHEPWICSFVTGVPVEGIDKGCAINLAKDGFRRSLRGSFSSSDDESRSTPQPPEEHMERRLKAGLQSWVQVPLNIGDRTLGVLLLSSRNKDAYGQDDVAMLERVAWQISPALRSARRSQQAESHAAEWSILAEMGRAIAKCTDIESVYSHAARSARLLIPFDRLYISAVDLERNVSVHRYIQSSAGEGAGDTAWLVAPLAGTVTEFVANSGRITVFQDLMPYGEVLSARDRLRTRLLDRGFQSALAVPLVSASFTVGVLHFRSSLPNQYAQRHIELAEHMGVILAGGMSHHLATIAAGASEAVGNLVRLELEPREPVRQIPLALVDRQALCRTGLKMIFRNSPVEVVYESTDLDSLRDALTLRQVEVVLWEIHADDFDGFGHLRALHQTAPSISTIVLSDSQRPDLLNGALASGASAFLLKGISPDRLVETVTEVASGGAVIEPQALKGLLQRLPSTRYSPTESELSLLARLSETDLSVLRALADGCTNAQIAELHHFAVGTIKNRLAKLYRLLGLSDRASATRFALRTGIAK